MSEPHLFAHTLAALRALLTRHPRAELKYSLLRGGFTYFLANDASRTERTSGALKRASDALLPIASTLILELRCTVFYSSTHRTLALYTRNAEHRNPAVLARCRRFLSTLNIALRATERPYVYTLHAMDTPKTRRRAHRSAAPAVHQPAH